MQDFFSQLLALFNYESFKQNIQEGWPLIAAAIVFYFGVYFFAPKLQYWLNAIRRRRKYWAYQALVGMRMSKRAKDIKVAEAAYEALMQLVDRNEITHGEKRKYLRVLEIAFDLEPGVIRPKNTPPNPIELKRRIRGRLSAKSANAQAIPPRRRLASILTMKG